MRSATPVQLAMSADRCESLDLNQTQFLSPALFGATAPASLERWRGAAGGTVDSVCRSVRPVALHIPTPWLRAPRTLLMRN